MKVVDETLKSSVLAALAGSDINVLLRYPLDPDVLTEYKGFMSSLTNGRAISIQIEEV